MATIHINNRSDFQILLKAEEGKTFPEFDFTLAFQTTGGFRYNVMSNDSKRFTSNADRTQAVITFDFADGDYFPNGRLAYTIKAEMQNAMFADGYENTQTPRLLDVIIWDGASDYSDAVEVDFVLPYVSVQAKSISPALLDTSNIIRKRLPYGAMAYQLYYTQLIRVPNALAAQDKFDDKVPQWLWKFFNEILSRYSEIYNYDNIKVYIQYDGRELLKIVEVGVVYDTHRIFISLEKTITFSQISGEAGTCLHLYFQLPQGAYYFDASRALRRLGGEKVSFGEHFLPDFDASGTLFRVVNNKYLVGDPYTDLECYVRRRKNHKRDDENYRWFYYWRKTRKLRQLSNAPVLAHKNYPVPQVCLVRMRKRLSFSARGKDLKHKTSPVTSKWKYLTVKNMGGGQGNEIEETHAR